MPLTNLPSVHVTAILPTNSNAIDFIFVGSCSFNDMTPRNTHPADSDEEPYMIKFSLSMWIFSLAEDLNLSILCVCVFMYVRVYD